MLSSHGFCMAYLVDPKFYRPDFSFCVFMCSCFSKKAPFSKGAYCSIVSLTVVIWICLTVLFLSVSGQEVLIFKRKATDKFAFRVEFNDKAEHIYPIFLDFDDGNVSEAFEDHNCSVVGVHDLCPTWGPLLHMNITKFLECPPYPYSNSILQEVYNDPRFFQITVGLRTSYSLLGSNIASVSLIIFTVWFLPSLLIISYRCLVPSEQWFDTSFVDFTKKSQGSGPSFLRPLLKNFLLNRGAIEE